MNRIILVGNGYDLALGLKTSYEDFLVDYFKSMIRQATDSVIENGEPAFVEDELISIEAHYERLNSDAMDKILNSIKNIEDVKSHRIIRFTHLYSFSEWKNLKSGSNDREHRFDVNIKSNLLQQLLGDYNWREIEGFYFNSLLHIFEQEKNLKTRNERPEDKEKIRENLKQSLKRLNSDFNELKFKLAGYLKKLSEPLNTRNSGYPLTVLDNLNRPLGEKEFKYFFNRNTQSETVSEIKDGLIVNFNYTNLLSNHLNWNVDEKKNYRTIHIHGTVHKPKEIIFGYGDDTHPMYSELELSGEDEYLRHLKSFHYPLSRDYIELMNFLEFDQFEVQVVGHSLGLSDRVLLKSIFEHDNCKCIRLIHRGRPDEKERMPKKYMALARHFDNKSIMRNKIAPFEIGDHLH